MCELDYYIQYMCKFLNLAPLRNQHYWSRFWCRFALAAALVDLELPPYRCNLRYLKPVPADKLGCGLKRPKSECLG